MIEQRSPEWFEQRAGAVTGSVIKDILKGKRGAYLQARETLKWQKVAELLKNASEDDQFSTYWTKRGQELEPTAIMKYEILTGEIVEQVGYVPHPEIDRTGASPDGLIDGVPVEIKCLGSKRHVQILAEQTPPDEYIYQIQWEIECTQSDRLIFIAFDDTLEKPYQIATFEIERDDSLIDTMKQEVIRFNAEVDEILEKIKGKENGN